MTKQWKQYGTIIFLGTALFGAASFLGIANINDIVIFTGFSTILAVSWKLFKDFKIKQKIQNYNNARNSNLSLSECKEEAKEWTKKEYQGEIKKRKGAEFNWDQAKSEPGWVYDFEKGDWIKLRYFYTPYGPKSKGTLIFVNATDGGVESSVPVNESELKENPFLHSQMYKQTVRLRNMILRDNDEKSGSDGMNSLPMELRPRHGGND